MTHRPFRLVPIALLPIALSSSLLSPAQAPAQPTAAAISPMPPDYRGVQSYVPGIFVTPVPNAPFTATVEVISHQRLPDGTENVRTTTNHVARDSAGRIYNERRQLVSTAFQGEPRLLSAHVYDPANRLSIFLDPNSRLARETILRRPPTAPPNSIPAAYVPADPNNTETDLGEQSIDGTTLHGVEKKRTLPAALSGTGQPITIVDEYWFAPSLSVYLIIKHNDPRTGEQIVAVTHIDRHEPPAVQFAIPAAYKIVDETPPEPIVQSAAPAPNVPPAR